MHARVKRSVDSGESLRERAARRIVRSADRAPYPRAVGVRLGACSVSRVWLGSNVALCLPATAAEFHHDDESAHAYGPCEQGQSSQYRFRHGVSPKSRVCAPSNSRLDAYIRFARRALTVAVTSCVRSWRFRGDADLIGSISAWPWPEISMENTCAWGRGQMPYDRSIFTVLDLRLILTSL